MKLSFLDPVYTEPGPFASVYLDTSRDIEDPESAIALRWRHLREALAGQGADRASVNAISEVVGTDVDVPGLHGQAIFTAHGALALAGELPKPPRRDTARFGTLPHTMPLIAQHAPEIPYLAATVHYAGAHTDDVEDTVEVDAEIGRWPLSKVSPGERLHRRIPVSEWHHAALRLAQELGIWAQRAEADLMVLGGDVWASNVLARRLPDRLRGRVVPVKGGPTAETRRALLEQKLDQLLAGHMSVHDRAVLETFLTQRARHRAAAEGLAAAVAALQRGQVEALLLNHHPESPLRLWTGPEPTQLSLTEDELRSFSVENRSEERADAALVRALVGTGAELVVVPEKELRLHEGVGVVLRYADAGLLS